MNTSITLESRGRGRWRRFEVARTLPYPKSLLQSLQAGRKHNFTCGHSGSCLHKEGGIILHENDTPIWEFPEGTKMILRMVILGGISTFNPTYFKASTGK
jgi:hypothetical protein